MATAQTEEDYVVRARERAQEGAEFLDAADRKWARKLTKPINMASTHNCILALLFGRYQIGVRSLDLDDAQTHALGFRGCTRELGYDMRALARYYKALNAAWEHEIQTRLVE